MIEVDWLAGFPPEWRPLRADFMCNPYTVTVSPEQYAGRMVAHYSIPQVQETGGPLIEPAEDIDSLKLLITVPTLLVSKLNPRKQTICIAEPQAELITLASGEFVSIRSDQFDRRYGYYVWLSDKVTDRLSAIVQSATRSHQRVNPADILKLPWKWPPLATQLRIAAFLDKKTAQIDGLIEKKRTLLERLAEKRQAIITQAVTKGLNPTAPMKDSGIDWLGKIPEHWEVKRLKFLTSRPLKYGVNTPADWDNPNWSRFVRITDVKADGSLRLETFRSLPPQLAAGYQLSEGDILLARSGATVGKSFIFATGWGDACFAGYLIQARISFDNLAWFVYRYLNSDSFWSWVAENFIQSTIQNISAEKYASLPVPCPPFSEQEAIAKFVKYVTEEITRQRQLVSASIERLAEYRSALITAAVTGQIEGLG